MRPAAPCNKNHTMTSERLKAQGKSITRAVLTEVSYGRLRLLADMLKSQVNLVD